MIREIVENSGEIAIKNVVWGQDPIKKDIAKYGIVYTPIELVEKIIGLIPDRYFSDPELKWLDVGAGTGAFSCVVYSRLYAGLKGVISDSSERHNHIITNMLYMIENYPVHIVKLREIFGENANIIDKDFLSGEIAPHAIIKNRKNVAWGQDPIPTFDFIIGNPPYNTGGKIKTPTDKNTSKKEDGVAAYVEFVKKSIKMLRYGGFLNMIIPNIWMKPDKAGLYNLLTGLNIVKLCCLSAGETNRDFRYQAQTPTSFFLIENIEDENDGYKTIPIIDETLNSIDPTKYRMLQNWPIPCHGVSIVNRLIRYVEKPDIGHLLFYKTNGCSKMTRISDKKGFDIEGNVDKTFRYCNIKTCYIDKEDGSTPYLVTNWSDRSCPYFGVPKLVLAHKMYGFPYLDISGEYGISTRDNYVISGQDYSLDELREIGAFLSTRFALYIFSTCNYRMRYLERYAFYFIPAITRIGGFPKLAKIKDQHYRDKKIYDYFQISMKERQIIENGFKEYHFFSI